MRWDFFVHHYGDPAKERSDPKYLTDKEGVWYPRAGTLGGCTSHNAMIFVYPSNNDWNQLADLTGDPSRGAPSKMRAYFERLEDCRHRRIAPLPSQAGREPEPPRLRRLALPTEKAAPVEAIRDRNIRRLFAASIHNALKEVGHSVRRAARELRRSERLARRLRKRVRRLLYADDARATYQRVGARERLLDVRRRYPDRLTIELNALATRVIFDDRKRAIGVEYLKGERLYQAHATPSDVARRSTRQVRARREVILAGGVFNTPQLLMLSGIGPEAELRRHGIPPVPCSIGVGRNLQDRYEVAVVNRLEQPWDMLRGATFTDERHAVSRVEVEPARHLHDQRRSALRDCALDAGAQPSPDLFCYALLADFRGYKPGYSKVVREHPNYLTWVVLKGHTNNTGGDGDADVARSARPSGDQLQLLRGRDRRQRATT